MKKLTYLFLALLMLACTTDDNNNVDNSNTLEKEWLYTHTALEATATSSTTLVIPFTADIFAFSDRPNREHKYISGGEFASYWNDYDDENSFKIDPPNAVLTWVDADGVSEVEVVITDANFDGNNIIYTIENTTITANQSFEDVSLFVDANGSTNAVYLASNGITVKASAGAQNNEQGRIGNITFTVVNLETLKFEISQGGDVSTLCTSLVTDMVNLFNDNTAFNQDISSWDVSNVTDMSGMFYGSPFNQDISSWDLGSVTNMDSMFQNATSFNQDNSSWDVSNVISMSGMFQNATAFNQDISSWDVSSVTVMSEMFINASAFNQDISSWSVDNVTNCVDFSDGAPLTEANTPNFTNCPNIYLDTNGVTIKANAVSANGYSEEVNGVTYTVVDLSTLNTMISNGDDVTKVVTSLITDMKNLFQNNTTFNQDISTWDVSNVTDMNSTFEGTSFNQDISNWDVSNVTTMYYMFEDSPFNQDISSWDVSSSITDTSGMFRGTPFNQDISSWDVSNVINMDNMFEDSPFNQDISSWDVSNVLGMLGMFQNATAFNQDISSWDVSSVTSCGNFSDGAPLTEANTPNFTNCTP